MRLQRLFSSAIPASALVVLLAACSSAVPTDTPGVEQLGEYVLRHTGPELETVIGYRYSAQNPGSEWLIVELALSSPPGKMAKVERGSISVRTPDGNTVKLASQQEFAEAYGELRSVIRAEEIARDPMDYFPPSRQPCGLDLFQAPGEGVVFDQVTVNDQRACAGKLFFRVPGGVQKGRWVLAVDLPESDIRIPFKI